MKKVKEKYVSEHPEARDRVFKPWAQKQPLPGHEDEDGNGAGSSKGDPLAHLYDEDGRLRDPKRSVYYDEVYNPYGVPPPGMPYLEKRKSSYPRSEAGTWCPLITQRWKEEKRRKMMMMMSTTRMETVTTRSSCQKDHHQIQTETIPTTLTIFPYLKDRLRQNPCPCRPSRLCLLDHLLLVHLCTSNHRLLMSIGLCSLLPWLLHQWQCRCRFLCMPNSNSRSDDLQPGRCKCDHLDRQDIIPPLQCRIHYPISLHRRTKATGRTDTIYLLDRQVTVLHQPSRLHPQQTPRPILIYPPSPPMLPEELTQRQQQEQG